MKFLIWFGSTKPEHAPCDIPQIIFNAFISPSLPPLTPKLPAVATPLENWGVLGVCFQAVLPGKSQQWAAKWDGEEIPISCHQMRLLGTELPCRMGSFLWEACFVSRAGVCTAGSQKTEAIPGVPRKLNKQNEEKVNIAHGSHTQPLLCAELCPTKFTGWAQPPTSQEGDSFSKRTFEKAIQLKWGR